MYTSTDKSTKLQKFTEDTAVIYIRVSHPRQVTNYSIPLVSLNQIVNISENILFRLIKNSESSFEPDTFICAEIINRMSTFLQTISNDPTEKSNR